MRVSWMLCAIVAVAGAALLTLSSGYHVENYSCAECRNCKRVETQSLLGIELPPKISIEELHPLPPAHIHRWWQFASYRQRGPGGIVAKQVACKPQQYEPLQTTADLASNKQLP